MKNTHRPSGRPDVMKVLADARPGELDPSRLVDPVRQREDLARIVAGETDGRAARFLAPRRRSGFRPLGAVALAAVAASVVVVSTLDSQGPADRTAAQPPSSAAAPSDGAGPGAGEDLRVDGHFELLSAARKAESSASEGTYWQTTTRSEHLEVTEAKGQVFAVRSTSTDEWSVGVRPGTASLMVSGLESATGPRTAADTARWHAAGSPRTVEVGIGKAAGTGKIMFTMGTGRGPMVMRTNVDDKIYAVGPNNVTYKDLRALPSTSGALSRYLERLHAQDNGADTGAGNRSAWMLRQAANLVTMPVKPGVRAAAYRVMADLPGVRVTGRVTDPLGRAGVGVDFPVSYRTPLGTTRERLVVDPSTGAMLSDEVVLLEPSAQARTAGLGAGTTVNYSATTRMSWGERQITVPKNARS
ncbi:CU044_5270 family protein [Streptomyces sp. MI02-7b]|uniref:CU044_5270 family protein n=1 Tax=Streptomyces sp. MI02-7b TaxID=462941 RepID=UPI0029B8753D|nr:CU044_5270 family protein [Streptomyces sp. MI02-7b]MDX3075625.1 CU044_5270 family protein [Streptomyces sp. MI02-7b]